MLYQIIFLLLAFSSSFHHSLPSCVPQQRSALLQFKNTLSVSDACDGYPKTNSWNQSVDCCSWEGVTCHKLTGHVIGINLSRSCLEGTLHENNSLSLPQHLQWLDLSLNSLKGPLLEKSSIFNNLHGLQRLELAYNYFNGSISSQSIDQLVSLTHLNLSSCDFSGLVPHEMSLLSNLVSLDLFSLHQLRFDSQGFDMLARNLTKLKDLVLGGVDMSGVKFTSFLNLTSSLEHLSLRECELHGEFPSQVFGLPNLRYIDLDHNVDVTGFLPKTNLTLALEWLSLYSCRFRGSIPVSLGNLTQIMFLDFSYTDLGGRIPDVFENHNELTTLRFPDCSFSGQIPSSLFNLTQLTFLDLSNNRLEGNLPSHVDRLHFLQYLSLSNNLVSGRVPPWLFSLPSLSILYLDNNTLSGTIDHFENPNSVKVIDLSFNNISGPIPDSVFDLVKLTDLYLPSNNLSGVLKLNELAKLENLYSLDLSFNNLLSLGTDDKDFNYSVTSLSQLSASSCSITKFPSFLRTSNIGFLNLSNNNISGGIAKWEAIGWENLVTLDLSFNFLTSLEQVPGNPESLDLSSNMLQGILSTSFTKLSNSSNMTFFSVSKNKLSGDIPEFICGLSHLQVLDLSENNLSGTIPQCLWTISVGLMNLGMNNLHGEIPDSVQNNNLVKLLLNDNQLEGSIPKSLTNCSSLALLNLRNNKLNDTFPLWLGSIQSLEVLILSLNRLHGSMPNSMASFDSLRILDVSNNEFTGPLPAQFFQNLGAMKLPLKKRISNDEQFSYATVGRTTRIIFYRASVIVTWKRMEMKMVKTLTLFISIDFSSNLFSGQIPKEVGELISVQALNFSNNNLTGPIPSSLGEMVALESLDLSSNKLGSRIPSQLVNLTFLAVLNLSRNDLVGPIPKGWQFNTFENDSYRDNLGLCDLPLSKQCNPKEMPKPPAPLHVKLKGSSIEIPFIWKIVMMGFGCGMVLGLSTGYIVFTTGRPWWVVRKVERDWQRNVDNWIRRNGGRRN